jgi:hypothetical protein
MFFYLIRIQISLLLILIYFGINSAGETGQISPASPLIQDYKMFDVNNISAYITNYGSFFRNANTGNSGFEWPKGSGLYAIYAAGPWIGAKVNGEPRVAVAEYSYEYRPGNINPLTHLPEDPADSIFKVYKIGEGGNLDDYQNWPGQLGAPVDSLGHPLLIGDQTLWMVYNDSDPSAHVNMGSLPLGVELQLTVFSWGRYTAVENVIFLHYLIINRGINHLDSVFFAIFCDPDLGNSSGDLVGCDTTTSLGYCYNSTDNNGDYGEHPPAVGIQILQGPLVPAVSDSGYFLGWKRPNSRNLPMTAFIYYNGNNANNGNPQTPREVYYYMQARWRDGTHITYGDYGINPNAPVTNYMFSGDPESGEGWLDSSPADRRLFLSSGPFDMLPGDSQEVVIAALIDRGSSNLNSATRLKEQAAFLNHFYDEYGYQLFRGSPYTPPQPPEPPIPERLGLFQNYPNPFNSRTTIKYQLPIPRIVHLDIFNAAGQKVATLVNESQEPDEYEVVWDVGGLASGIYFARLRVAQYTFTKKLLLLK